MANPTSCPVGQCLVCLSPSPSSIPWANIVEEGKGDLLKTLLANSLLGLPNQLPLGFGGGGGGQFWDSVQFCHRHANFIHQYLSTIEKAREMEGLLRREVWTSRLPLLDLNKDNASTKLVLKDEDILRERQVSKWVYDVGESVRNDIFQMMDEERATSGTSTGGSELANMKAMVEKDKGLPSVSSSTVAGVKLRKKASKSNPPLQRRLRKSTKIYRCDHDQCGLKFDKPAFLRAHKEKHKDPKDRCPVFFCYQCKPPYPLFRKGSVKSHVKNVHVKETNYTCPHCGKKVPTPTKLKIHVTHVHKNEINDSI